MSNFSFLGSGSLILSGKAIALSSYHEFEGNGNLIFSGISISFPRFFCEGEGILGISSNTDIKSFNTFFQEINWNLRSFFEIEKKIIWDTGDILTRIFQVQGSCRFPSCTELPISTDDVQCAGALGKNQFIQTIFATSLKGVCDFLVKTGWKWPIHSIKKFSQPLSALVIINGSSPPICNELKEVEFCNIPECFDFCLQTDGVVNAKMEFSVIENIYRVNGNGRINLFGTYYGPKKYIGLVEYH